MASVAVVVPWQPGCRHREAVWRWLKPRWPWEVIEGTTDGPWCKAAAIGDALTRTSTDLLVIADADVWSDHTHQAIQAVEQGAPWAVPHYKVHRLTEQATVDILNGGWNNNTTEPPYKGQAGGGITVLPRDLYERVPLDPRFMGWGQEDQSWELALNSLAGKPWRGTKPLWHLWHPPQDRTSRRYGSHDNKRLWQRYHQAMRAAKRGDRTVMEQLVEEARAHQAQPSRGTGNPSFAAGR